MDALQILESAQQKYPTTEVDRPVEYVIDLGHLAAFDINATDALVNEADVCQNVRDGVQMIINSLWKRQTRVSDDHTCLLASLPEPEYKLPREKPLPKPKSQTRWEKFAQEKGIQKEKRSRLVYDDEAKDWIPRHGYKGATQKEDWIIEVPENADPYEDQYQKKREEKKSRVEKNKKQQQRNDDASKATEKGVSVSDVRSSRKLELHNALKVSTKSTASLGKFDKKLETTGIIKIKGDKRKFDSVVDLKKEKEMSAKILKKIMN